ncbi:hypothetical protein ACFXG4_51885 [Nocardia sp. NPDC059246]|uniref:hypothetical protein n=1 Tax=unclassified Nocardia TaxID=2637762 RepID=UPI003699AFF4
MVSWREELERREAAGVARAKELCQRITELSEQLDGVEQELSRLRITRETMGEILGVVTDPTDGSPADSAGVAAGDEPQQPERERERVGGSPIGVMLVPPRGPGVLVSELPQDYRDILEILADAGRGLRTGHVAAALGCDEERSTVESLRSKLKRLVARGWLDEQMPGLFVLADGVDVNT